MLYFYLSKLNRSKCFLAACFLLFAAPIFANSVAEYEVRRIDYLNAAVQAPGEDSLIVQAYFKYPLDQAALDEALAQIHDKQKTDFIMNKLVRVLFYTEEAQDKILAALKKEPLWLTKGEQVHQYWSENHMMLWMSSAWLLHESFGFELSDDTLRERLVHVLKLKVEYGFYEFFSPTYFPYTLSGLLNLADFAKDQEIKMLATEAAVKLLHQVLLFVNQDGAFYPAAGRAHANKYMSDPGSQNHTRLIYLILGLGTPNLTPSQIGSFIATTNLDMSSVIASYQPTVDLVIKNGHPLSKSINSGLSRADRTFVQWSSGAYFHPKVVEDTLWLVEKMDLWEHEAFRSYFKAKQYSPWFAKVMAGHTASITKSSVLSESNVALYKYKSVVLSSVQNFWPGSQGYQQWPWVATLADVAIWTQSGQVYDEWSSRSKQHANAVLPYIAQKSHVALMIYKPNPDLVTIKKPENTVSLYWPDTLDETVEHERWLFGRRKEAYIAIYRPCTGKIKGFYACHNEKAQTWAVIVGHASTDGEFQRFIDETMIHTKLKTDWPWNWQQLRYDYYAKLQHKGITLEKTLHDF